MSCNDIKRTDNIQSAYNNEETSVEELLMEIDAENVKGAIKALKTGWYKLVEIINEPLNIDGDIDMVNEPPHYATRNIQPNDYIDDLLEWNTALTPREGYCVGQIHRYLGRAGMKEGNEKMQDFKKAQYYMNRMIGKQDE